MNRDLEELSLIRYCMVTEGAGWAPDTGVELALRVSSDLVFGYEPWAGPNFIIEPRFVTDLVIQGRSEARGTRLWGGGVGATGAAIGIGVASLVNALTKSTKHLTLLKVETIDGYLVVQIEEHEAWIKDALRPFRDALVESKIPSGADMELNSDLLEKLERLAVLREKGHLDGQQFEAAKNGLLGLYPDS